MEITDLVVESKVTKKVFYLSYDYSSAGNTLYARDLPLSHESSHPQIAQKVFSLQSTLAIAAAANNGGSHGNIFSSKDALSKEEELLRERQRKFANGVSSYETLCVDGTLHLLVPAYGSIYFASLGASFDGSFNASLFNELRTNDEGARVDVKWSPDAKAISYIKRNEIWISSRGGDEVRLTYATDRPHHSAGVAEFIMQEEFDRYTGYWWAPTSAEGQLRSQHRILYCEVDESMVKDFHVSEPMDIRGSIETFKYPLAGEDNAVTELCLLEFDMDALFEAKRRHVSTNDNSDVDVVVRSLVKEKRLNLNKRFPNFEYVVRCGWTPNSDRVWIQLVDRKQQRLVLLAIDLSLFVHSYEASTIAIDEVDDVFDQPGVILLWKEDSDCWINIGEDIRFLGSWNDFIDDSHRLLWTSEYGTGKSQHRHLFLVRCDKKKGSDWSRNEFSVTRDQITGGEWQILSVLNVITNSQTELIFFTANKDTPLRRGLYVTSSTTHSPTKAYRRLTMEEFDNEGIILNEECNMFACNYSNSQVPTQTALFSISYPRETPKTSDEIEWWISNIVAQPLFRISSAPSDSPPATPTTAIEFFAFTSSSTGETIYGSLMKPSVGTPPYPTVVHVYGGPHVQVVLDSLSNGLNSSKMRSLTSAGFLVISVDNSGSWRRGRKFESHLYRRLGYYEVEDQVDAVRFLVSKGLTDPGRVAISGWSYGGYLSLMALATRPAVFKVAVAGAPVTMWEAYDTGYTERYLSTPQDNPTGYHYSSVLPLAPSFPSEDGRLLILHGLKDDNVHLCHTANLIEALIQNGKPYHLCVFPRERHGCRKYETSQYAERKMISFIKKFL